jgi:uncharacterized membrane protein
MALTAEHRAELEVLGPETVRIRLRSSDLVTVISGFKTPTTRSDIEGWLTEKRIQGESEHRQWSWTIQAYVFAFLATAVVLLSVHVKDQLLAIYSISGVVGWLAGAIAYFCWNVLRTYQRKTKQRAVTWLPLGASVAAMVGFIWWLHFTVRFDVALTAAALIGPMPPAPMVAPEPVTPVAPVAPEPVTSVEPVAPAPVTPVAPVAPEPVTSVEPVAPAPVTPVAPVAPEPVTSVEPALNPSFTCTRIGNITTCSK